MDNSGNFVVTWTLTREVGEDGAEIYARLYAADGTPIAPAFRVNQHTAEDQSNADIAMDSRGNFVIAWQGYQPVGRSIDVYAQLFDGSGNRIENEVQVNESTVRVQRWPAIAMRPLGTWAIAWASDQRDGVYDDVYARRYHHEFKPYAVTSIADPGDGICTSRECTLREVLAEADANPGGETIGFAIPGDGHHTIRLNSRLEIKSGVVIDGYTQPGAQPNTNPFGQGLNTVIKVAIAGGIDVRSGVTFKGLALSGDIDVYQTSATFHGDFIGADISGTTATGGGITLLSGGGTLHVGGGEPAQRNLIIGRVYAGTYGNANVSGNLMGTDISGTRRLGGGDVVGMNSSMDISNNLLTSVSLFEASASISGNYIGVDVTGTQPLGGGSISSGFGAGFNATNNLIAYTGGTPIIIGNSGRLSGNRIFANGGLGIDVGNDGVSLNDPGDLNNAGRGGKQNFPIANWVYNDGGETVVEGILDSRPNSSYPVEFFANSVCDPSGFGEGERILGSATVTTDGNGKALYRLRFPGETPAGAYVTATATGPNTSEFSPCRVADAMLLNGALSMSGFTTSYRATPVANAPGGVYTIMATFTNRMEVPLRELYYRITSLTENNLVLNAQAGTGG
ncbi:MAG: hypothetical protein R2867_01535 [Caldilineaceae bacterium]